MQKVHLNYQGEKNGIEIFRETDSLYDCTGNGGCKYRHDHCRYWLDEHYIRIPIILLSIGVFALARAKMNSSE
jgi:hypothetical protein